MSYIVTKSGIEFSLVKPDPETVRIRDIAHSLARIRRFNGHTGANCSVALHSVIVSHLVPAEDAFNALLHDAHEAYIGDISTPVGRLLGRELRVLKVRLDDAIGIKFNADLIHPSQSIKVHDIAHLAYERHWFLPGGKPWELLKDVTLPKVTANLWDYYADSNPEAHELLFLERFNVLQKWRDQQ